MKLVERDRDTEQAVCVVIREIKKTKVGWRPQKGSKSFTVKHSTVPDVYSKLTLALQGDPHALASH